MDRRSFLTHVSWALLCAGLRAEAFTDPVSGEVRRWALGVHTRYLDLRSRRLSPTQWQEAMTELAGMIDLSDLLEGLDVERLISGMAYPDDRAAIAPVHLPEIEGLPGRGRGWSAKIFGLARGRAIVPHAHNDMVSAHLVISGRFRVRTFGRLYAREEPGRLCLRPSIDTELGPGSLLTMSDDRDNIHWLVAQTDTAHTLDVPITDLGSDRVYGNSANRYSMIFVDPSSPLRGDGTVSAPILAAEEALARFGHASDYVP